MYRLVEDREEALRIGFIATDWWGLPITFEQYKEVFKEWKLIGIFRNNECIGTVFRNGEELHIAVLPQYYNKWCNRKLLNEIFKGPVFTHGLREDKDQTIIRILKKLGFVKINDRYIKEY
jgi:hypothetical protein